MSDISITVFIKDFNLKGVFLKVNSTKKTAAVFDDISSGLPSGVSVSSRTSNIRKRRVILLLLPGQPQPRHCHPNRGHLPLPRPQPSTHGASRKR